jgi:pentatricopeptide repeat protein
MIRIRRLIPSSRLFAAESTFTRHFASANNSNSQDRPRSQYDSKRPSHHRQQQQQQGRRQDSSPHVTKEWEGATHDLLTLSQWNPSHKRKAEQCLQHWSKQKLYKNNEIILNLWSRVQQEVPQQETAAAMYDYAILALAKNGFAEEAFQVFEAFLRTTFGYTSQNNRHIPSSYHLSAVLHALSKSNQPERGQQLLMRMYKEGPIEPNVYCVTSVLDGWSRMGQGQKAQDLLDDCIAKGLQATVACYNAVLTAWSRDYKTKEAPQRAKDLLNSMPVKPDAATWSSFLVACRNPSQMEPVLWQAYRQGEPVNAVCFNVVLNAWGKAGKVNKGEQFLRQWVQLIADNPNTPRDLWPKLSTFNTLLNALAKVGDSDRAKYWLEEMQRMGVTPDGISYNSYIDTLARRGKAREAQAEWERVRDRMDRRNQFFACNSIISAWANHARQTDNKEGIVQHVRGFMRDMEERGLVPNIVTNNALLKVIGACNEPELAEDILRQMKGGFVQPDIVSYSVVIDAYAKSRKPDAAHEVHRFITVPPNVVSFNSVIHAYSKSDDMTAAERAESVLEEMKEANIEPDLMTYCSLLTVWSNTKHLDKATRARLIMDMMVAKYAALSPQHRNAEELLRNAKTMVVAACAYLPLESPNEAEALLIARQTFAEIEKPTYVTYATYLQALHRLERDAAKQRESISEVFLRYCGESNEIDPLVLRRLQMVTSPEVYTQLLATGQKMQGELASVI